MNRHDTDSYEISPSEIWEALYLKKYWIAAASFFAAVLAAGATYLIRPVFRAEVLVVPVSEQTNALRGFAAQFSGLAELAGVNLAGGGNSRAAAIATLKSRSLTESFILEHNLLPILFANEWDAVHNRWKTSDAKQNPTAWDGYELVDKRIRKIEIDRKSGLVALAIEWYDPETAAQWANELVYRANSRLQQETIEEGKKTIKYLEQQLTKATSIEVRQALYSVIEMETKNIAVAHAREEFAFKVVDPAVPPRKRIRPKRTQITLLGLTLGFLGASAIAVVLRRRP